MRRTNVRKLSLYIAIDVRHRYRLPPTVLPHLAQGKCTRCETPVLYSQVSVQRRMIQCRQAGYSVAIVCPTCGVEAIGPFPACVLMPPLPEGIEMPGVG